MRVVNLQLFNALAFPLIYFSDFFFSFFVGEAGGRGVEDDVMVGVLCCTTAAALSSIPARAEGGQARPQMDSV